ncbi:hypothetical protein [Roseomonas fluvialis]|uniref:DUF2268 domain-containing protein n=1 Tax=Roseomonas fluvialis TaxID=1750527 RepID=A0ABN6P4I7_9PROT|nr:hypothetical protein [Roseomonas fluvialis]BDG73582.1 hypothetical protein Rmf_35110 [Roseomonas fluvialis]
MAAMALTGTASAQGTCPGLEDLMPAFWTAHDTLPAGDDVARGRALVASWFTPQIEAYRAARVGRVDVARWLALFDPVAPVVRRLSAALPALWCDRLLRFRVAVPDASPSVPALAFVSFLNFDAATRLWHDRVVLFLGLDMMALLHGEAVGPLLDHERFHMYHHEVNPSLILPGGDPLWLGIWKEGLAVHATAVLNPGLPRIAVFLGDAGLADAGPELFRRLAAELPDRLHATAGEVRARYLGYGYRGDIPARSGYALGAAIVARVAAGRDLAALARIPAPEAEALLRTELAAMAR